ncbi:hypothetical protein N7534_010244 [Penicillium rubens]|nr:hypothetical protein N7534_010244 [Penicillium rubens]
MSEAPADPYRDLMVNYAPHDSGKDANREDSIPYGATQLLQERPTEIRYHSNTTQPPFGSPSTFITSHSPQRQPGSHYNTHGYRLSPIQGSRKRQRTDNGPEASEDTEHNYGYRPILQTLPMGDPSAPGGEPAGLTYADVGPSSSHQTSNQDYLQGSRKRRRTDNGPEASEDTEHNYGYRPILQNLPMGDPSAPGGEPAGLPYADVGPSSSHQTSNQDYLQPALPQQHHHHRLPPQAFGASSAGDQYQPQIDRSFMNLPGVPAPYPQPRAPKTRFGHKEDEMLIALKEHWKFSWRQIECFFPGRKQQTLQVRYCTKLKERDVVWDIVLDQKLKKALEDYEDNKWAHISRKLGPGIPPAASNHTRSDQSGFKLAQPQTSKLPLLPQTPRVNHPITSRTMFLQRTASALARRSPARAFTLAQRPFSSSVIRSNEKKWAPKQEGKILTFDEIKGEDDLFAPGAKPGTIPTDLDQATGLERLELIGKMQGIDIFDMRPLDASRKGTLQDPIIVNGAGDEQYAGCTGFPADSHQVTWLTVSRERPIERCLECGNVVKLNYIGPEEDPHAHDHDHGHHHPPHVEPKTFADYVKPDYWYR